MNITVCVKQVPDTADIKWNENNTLNREGVESILNPFDAYAVETALRIKDHIDAKITAITMGPIQAKNVLEEVISMGVDEGLLLNDKNFAGSDTASTARILADAIDTEERDCNLIICGQCAIDGDTAQTGPSLAQNLEIGVVTNVKEVEEIDRKYVVVKKQTDEGYERIKLYLPAVICVLKGDYEVRMPKISGRIKAQNTNIPILNAIDIKINGNTTGIKGSPTYVKKAFKPEGRRSDGEIVEGKTDEEISDLILNKIAELKKD